MFYIINQLDLFFFLPNNLISLQSCGSTLKSGLRCISAECLRQGSRVGPRPLGTAGTVPGAHGNLRGHKKVLIFKSEEKMNIIIMNIESHQESIYLYTNAIIKYHF